MRKTISILLLFVLLLSLLTACQSGLSDTILFDENGVRVTTITPSKDRQMTDYVWLPTTDELVYDNNEFILSGTITNIREIQIEYRYMEADLVDHATLFDFTISNVVYKPETSGISIDDVITVGVPFNSYAYCDTLPILSDESEFLLFCTDPTNLPQNDLVSLSSYVDYWCSSPNCLLIEKIDDYYLADSFFADYVSSSEKINMLDAAGSISKDAVTQNAMSVLSSRGEFRSAESDSWVLSKYILLDGSKFEAALSEVALTLREGK